MSKTQQVRQSSKHKVATVPAASKTPATGKANKNTVNPTKGANFEKTKPGRPTIQESLSRHRSNSTSTIKELFTKRKRSLEESFEKTFTENSLPLTKRKKLNTTGTPKSPASPSEHLPLTTSSPTDMGSAEILKELKNFRDENNQKFQNLEHMFLRKIEEVKEEQRGELRKLEENFTQLNKQHAMLEKEVENLKKKTEGSPNTLAKSNTPPSARNKEIEQLIEYVKRQENKEKSAKKLNIIIKGLPQTNDLAESTKIIDDLLVAKFNL